MEIKKSEKANLESKKGIFLQIGFVITLSLILVAFEWSSRSGKISELELIENVDIEEEIIPVTRQEQNQPPPPPPPPAAPEILNIVEDDVELDEELVMEDMEADQNTQIEINFEEEEEGEPEVFFIVEEMPSFNGGNQDEFRKYIQQNLKYPQIAAENGISGRVFVYFVVNEKGEIINSRIARGVDPALDKEALRVVNTSPKWTPGKQRGKPVRVAFTFPIVFVLQ